MALLIKTDNPDSLLAEIKKAIRDGKIETWNVDDDGDFTHNPPQWRNKAWFRPKVSAGVLIMRILTPKGTHMNSIVYGIYHGRFVEELLMHFDRKFSQVEATALPAHGDVVKSVSDSVAA